MVSIYLQSKADEYDEILEELYLKYRKILTTLDQNLSWYLHLLLVHICFNASRVLKGFWDAVSAPPQMRGPPKLDISDDDRPIPPINPFPKPFGKT